MPRITLRQLTNDSNHNAFTGACFFKGALYVGFRQGDAHVCDQGRLIVLRSRDGGEHFDIVAVVRGQYDTRDAHLYSDGKRLFLNGFEYDYAGKQIYAGCAWTEDGLHWSQWTRYAGAEGHVFWRPRFFRGTYYCAAYIERANDNSEANWFESKDGLSWRKVRCLHSGSDMPNECCMDFHLDGSITMIMRREHASRKPLLLRSRPPYETWSKTELDLPLLGPALWLVGDDVWISGRWFVGGACAHVGVFKIENDKPVLQFVLPSGPDWDLSYTGVARDPDDARHIWLSYYSGHVGPKTNIFLADVHFEAAMIGGWKYSAVRAIELAEARCPDPSDPKFEWKEIAGFDPAYPTNERGFLDAHERIAGQSGVVYFVTDLDVGPCDQATLFLGYDGPVLVWVNGERVFAGVGTNPAVPDKSRVRVRFRHGVNRIAVALDTNGGKAWGIFVRYEPVLAD